MIVGCSAMKSLECSIDKVRLNHGVVTEELQDILDHPQLLDVRDSTDSKELTPESSDDASTIGFSESGEEIQKDSF